MAFCNGSLILGLAYANYPTTLEAQPSTAATPRLHQRHLSERRRGELPAVVEPEYRTMEILIGHSKQPQYLKSIDDLAAFSAAVDVFKRQFDDLQKHIESIKNAIESKLKSNGVYLAASSNFQLNPNELPRKKARSHLWKILIAIAL